jgi:branched-chain amino acid transport system substrate-binding protein/urea transport system substrate-binding protein
MVDIMKMKRIIALAASMILMASLAGCGSTSTSSAAKSSGSSGSSDSSSGGDPIKVGVLFSATGSTAINEKTMTNACIMAFDEINAAGGINGRKIEYIHEDYASDPAKCTEKIKKLIEQDEVVATVGCCTSASRQATLTTLKDDDSLLIYPTYTEGEEIHPNVIYVGAMPNQQAVDFIPYLLQNIGKKVFLVGSDYVFPKTCNKEAKALIEQNGGEVVGEEYAPLGQTDFSTICNKIKQSGADLVYSTVVGESNVSFYKDYKQYGLNPETCPICTISIEESVLQAIGTEYAEGNYASMPYFASLDTPASKEFVDKYNKKFNDGTVVTVLTESAYSSCYLLAEALKKVDDPTDTDALIKAFNGLEFDAPQGKIKVDDYNHCTWVYSRFAKIHYGKFDIIYSSDKAIRPEPWPAVLYPQYKNTNFMPDWDDPICYPQ